MVGATIEVTPPYSLASGEGLLEDFVSVSTPYDIAYLVLEILSNYNKTFSMVGSHFPLSSSHPWILRI